jgi:hypothetical protein
VALTGTVVHWTQEARRRRADRRSAQEEVTSMADKQKDRKDGKKRDQKKDGGKK